MNYNQKLKDLVNQYLKEHPSKYDKNWTCRVRGSINDQPVSVFFDCFDCDIISALDPDNMEEVFTLSGANYVSHLTGCSPKIGFVNLRLITKSHPDISLY